MFSNMRAIPTSLLLKSIEVSSKYTILPSDCGILMLNNNLPLDYALVRELITFQLQNVSTLLFADNSNLSLIYRNRTWYYAG